MAGVRDNTVSNVVNGGIASFKSVGEVPLKSLKVNFNPIQEGDGDPSPSNIRPIQGWTGLNVNQSKKNLFNLNWLLTSTGSITDGVLRDAMYRLYNAFALTVNPIPNTKYMDRITVSVTAKTTQDYTSQGRGFTIKVKYDDGTSANLVYFSNTISEYTTVIGTSAENKKVVSLHVDYGSGGSNIWFIKDIIITSGSTSTTYEPYNGSTIPVSWSDLGTVYGGYVDLVIGKLVATIIVANVTKDSNVKFNLPRANQPQIIYNFEDNNLPTGANKNILSYSHGTLRPRNTASGNYPQVNAAVALPYNTTTERINIGLPTDITNMEEYLAWLENVGGTLQVSYELETPIQYDITPQEIKSLIGTNNIWSNANDTIEAEYYFLESLDVYKQRFKANEPYLETATGSVANFTTDMVSPLKECKVYFEPIQASGTPSPDNVLPISGWNELSIWHVDEVMPMNYIIGETTSYGVTWTVNQDGVVYAEGTPTSYAGCSYANIDVNGDEILYGVIKGNLNNVAFNKPTLYDENWNVISISGSDNILQDGLDLSQYTGVKTVRVNIKRSRNDVYMQGDTRVIVQKNNPPSINTTSITLPSTYYGGWVDLITGEVYTSWYHFILDGINYKLTTGSKINDAGMATVYNYFGSGGLTGLPVGPTNQYTNAIICNKFSLKYDSNSNTECIQTGSGLLYMRLILDPNKLEDTSTSAKIRDSINTWLSENPLQIVYKLATPLFVGTITPQQLKTLKNQNNIWSNTNGITEVKYWTHGSLANRKKVIWNQWIKELNANNFTAYNSSNINVSFSDGVATIEYLEALYSYRTAIKSIDFYPVDTDDIIYSSFEIKQPENDTTWGSETTNKQNSMNHIPANTWTKITFIVNSNSTNGIANFILPECWSTNNIYVGLTCQVRNPLIINLTQMFGAGNEPTKEEFEALCARNGIDLTQYQPYNTGTELYWYM